MDKIVLGVPLSPIFAINMAYKFLLLKRYELIYVCLTLLIFYII